MIGVQKRKATCSANESVEFTNKEAKMRQPISKGSRKRGKFSTSTLSSMNQNNTNNKMQKETTVHQEESVWIYGLINNIEQLLSTFNTAINSTSTSSSQSSPPSSVNQRHQSIPSSMNSSPTASNSPSCSSSSCSSSAATSPAMPAVAQTNHVHLPRSPISRQIKFHEYKGPPSAKRQQQTGCKLTNNQPDSSAKVNLIEMKQQQMRNQQLKTEQLNQLTQEVSMRPRVHQQLQQQQQLQCKNSELNFVPQPNSYQLRAVPIQSLMLHPELQQQHQHQSKRRPSLAASSATTPPPTIGVTSGSQKLGLQSVQQQAAFYPQQQQHHQRQANQSGTFEGANGSTILLTPFSESSNVVICEERQQNGLQQHQHQHQLEIQRQDKTHIQLREQTTFQVSRCLQRASSCVALASAPASSHLQQQQLVAVEPNLLSTDFNIINNQPAFISNRSNEQLNVDQLQVANNKYSEMNEDDYLLNELTYSPNLTNNNTNQNQENAFNPFGNSDSDDTTDTCEIEPSIGFSHGADELLFSEFIDLQDVPMNVDESDWLKKFLPPCSMG